MGEFIKFVVSFTKEGRRRLGIRMLVLASFFTCGWIRSLAHHDEIMFHTNDDRSDSLLSTDGSICWESRHNFKYNSGKSLSFMEVFTDLNFLDISPSMDSRRSRWDWKWYWCGFAVGSAVLDIGNWRRSVWIVPYWSIALPLIALSAWLLLSKHPQPAGIEPTPVEGA